MVHKKIASQIIAAAIVLIKTVFLIPRGCCRHTPSCSEFAKIAIEQLPPPTALQVIFKRLLKCHPFSRGGYDPVPEIRPVKEGCRNE